MADKNYFEFLDIPDGSGGTERWHAKDAEAQANIAQVASAIGVDTDYEFVDLGLPSGTLWAKCNVGATEETDYGNYYMYGKGATQYNSGDSAYTGTEDPLDAQYDTATQVMGASWHMPTRDQVIELTNYTTYSWEEDFNGSGINGAKFTAANGNYIFFPAGGYMQGNAKSVGSEGDYWSSNPSSSATAAVMFKVQSGSKYYTDQVRGVGCAVRAVKKTIIEQLDDRYTKYEVNQIASSITDGAQAAEIFTLAVDPDTMELKAISPMAYLNAWKLEDGYLGIDITAVSPSS